MSANLSRGISFIAGIAVGVLGAVWYFAPNTLMQPAPVATDATATASSTLPQGSGDVDVSNQAAGDSVLVNSVTVPPPGVWVAVQDVNQDGSLGNVLGAAKVGGPRSNVTVSLLRNTLANSTYAIVLYRDDNGGPFEVGQESVYVDFDTGQPVEMLFETN